MPDLASITFTLVVYNLAYSQIYGLAIFVKYPDEIVYYLFNIVILSS
jgi:hypothetical protein